MGVLPSSPYVSTEAIESIQGGDSVKVRQEEQAMAPDPFGSQELESREDQFAQGQGVRIVDGAFAEYVGTVSES
jgi:transcription antitermination factor NusG